MAGCCSPSGPAAGDVGPCSGARAAREAAGGEHAGPSWGEMRPVRRAEWHERDGRVVVLRPRLGAGRAGRWLERVLRLPAYRVRLDDVGTFVWLRCDGSVRVHEVAEALRTAFGERVEPAEGRLTEFLRQLSRARLLELRAPG